MSNEIISPTPAPGRCSFLRRAVPKPAKLVAPLLFLLGLSTAPDITANIKLPTNEGTISISASNVTVENVFDVNTTYSKHEETNVSWSDAAKALSNPQSGEKRKNGKVTKKISDATYDASAEKTTTSTVVGSNLSGANIQTTRPAPMG